MIIIGMDPSLRSFGISDGDRHDVIATRSGWDLDERIDAIVDGVFAFVEDARRASPIGSDSLMLVAEAPNLGAMDAPGSHLYEIGGLMRAIRAEVVPTLRDEGFTVIYLEVQVTTLRHHTVGVGNAAKVNLPYMVDAIHGKTFDDDRGIDKLVAWSLWKYGCAIEAGEIEHAFAAARGQGTRAKRTQKKAARERATRLAS